MGVETKNFGVLNNIVPMVQQAGLRVVNRLVEHAKNSAIMYYKDKRGTLSKSKRPLNPTSFIIASFVTQHATAKDLEFKGVVFCGGPAAPYAVFVDQPRNNGSFPGYFFMKAGAEAAEEIAPQVLSREFKNIGQATVKDSAVISLKKAL